MLTRVRLINLDAVDTATLASDFLNWGGYSLNQPREFQTFTAFWAYMFNFFTSTAFDKTYYPVGVIWTIPIELQGFDF